MFGSVRKVIMEKLVCVRCNYQGPYREGAEFDPCPSCGGGPRIYEATKVIKQDA